MGDRESTGYRFCLLSKNTKIQSSGVQFHQESHIIFFFAATEPDGVFMGKVKETLWTLNTVKKNWLIHLKCNHFLLKDLGPPVVSPWFVLWERQSSCFGKYFSFLFFSFKLSFFCPFSKCSSSFFMLLVSLFFKLVCWKLSWLRVVTAKCCDLSSHCMFFFFFKFHFSLQLLLWRQKLFAPIEKK